MEGADQIRKHIDVLTKFEHDYREYISAREADDGAESAYEAGYRGDEDIGSGWTSEKYRETERQLSMDAVRADRAIKASGVGGLIFTHAPAAGGGIRAADLPSQIFDFIEVSRFGNDDGMSFQRKLLERMPSQIAGLEIKLEEAEVKTKRPKLLRDAPVPRLFSRVATLPPWLGFIADLITVIGFVVATAGVGGKLLGAW